MLDEFVAKHFSSRSDAELMAIAKDGDSLSPSALPLLRAEFTKRALPSDVFQEVERAQFLAAWSELKGWLEPEDRPLLDEETYTAINWQEKGWTAAQIEAELARRGWDADSIKEVFANKNRVVGILIKQANDERVIGFMEFSLGCVLSIILVDLMTGFLKKGWTKMSRYRVLKRELLKHSFTQKTRE